MSVWKAPEHEWTKDGRKYFFSVTYKNAKGESKRHKSKKYFTKLDAYEAERTFVLSRDREQVDTTITFKELYNLFYEFQSDKVKASTIRNYKNKITYLEPFMNKKIYELNIDLYMKWRNELNSTHLATRTKTDILKFFKSILNFGTRWYNYDFREMYNKIIKTYTDRVEIEKYCHVAPMSEVIENEYNLNIPRYVDTFEEEEEIDIKAVQEDLKEIDKQIEEVDKELNVYLKELGLEEI